MTLLLWEADEPDHFEDITAHLDTKLAALLAHRSQYRSTMRVEDPEAFGELERFRRHIRDRTATPLIRHRAERESAAVIDERRRDEQPEKPVVPRRVKVVARRQEQPVLSLVRKDAIQRVHDQKEPDEVQRVKDHPPDLSRG